MKIGARLFGVLAGVLLLYLLVGLLLPGTWRAEAEIEVEASPAAIFPLVNRLSSWQEWTPVPETGLVAFGPPAGVGAGVRWDDPRYGSGEVRVIGSEANRVVRYEVAVEGGALSVLGTVTLIPEAGGTRIRWVEEGDFGWNPLMGYAARGMAASQAETMKAGLEALSALARGEGSDTPSSIPPHGT